jgi:hypothetical protein
MQPPHHDGATIPTYNFITEWMQDMGFPHLLPLEQETEEMSGN